MSSGQQQASGNSGHQPEGAHAAPPATSAKKVAIFFLFVLIVAVILALTGILPRIHAEKKLAEDTNSMAVPQVMAIELKEGAPVQEIVLPGNIQAYRDAPIFARTNGYLRQWYVDIGGRAKKGQLLAVIDSPEVDQQLQQARADLATAQSNSRIAQTTASRYTDLVKTKSVSEQDAENFAAAAQSQLTMVHSAEANVKRLEELQSFEKIIAPFDGVITARNTDNGQLINSGNLSTGMPGGNGRELFHIAAIDTLRVFVNVPQVYSRNAKPATTVNITLQQFPGRKFSGTLVRNANAIDPATRTLLIEVDVKNSSGELLPGSYAEVHLPLDTGTPSVLLPVSALIFRQEGLRVAALDGDHVRLIPIVMGRDFGTQVEVLSGLTPHQRIIDSPPDSLSDGEQVNIIQRQKGSPVAAK